MISPSCTEISVVLVAQIDTYWSACFGWLLYHSYRGFRHTAVYLGTYSGCGVQFPALYNNVSLGVVGAGDWYEGTCSPNRNASRIRGGDGDCGRIGNYIGILRENFQ